jgi:hypothetical protein
MIADLEHDNPLCVCRGAFQTDLNSCARFRVTHGIADHILSRPVQQFTIPYDHVILASQERDVAVALAGFMLGARNHGDNQLRRDTGWKLSIFSTASMDDNVSNCPLS